MSDWDNQAISLIILTEEVTGYSGLFGYSPAPGAGNLILSVAARAGTDPWGNDYPQGISSKYNVFSGGTISGATFEGSDYFVNADGAFFYSGPPALGNLFKSISAFSGTDPYGNAYLPGFVSYFSDSGTYYAFVHDVGGTTPPTAVLQLWSGASAAGPYVTTEGLIAFAAGGGVEIASALQIDQTATISGALTATGGTPAAPTLITTDSWHGLGTSGLGLTGVYRYRLTPDNEIEIDIRGSINAKTGGTASWANPVSPVPATVTDGIWPVAMNTTDSQGRIGISSTGIVTMYGFGTNVTNIGVTQRIPLD